MGILSGGCGVRPACYWFGRARVLPGLFVSWRFQRLVLQPEFKAWPMYVCE